MLEVLNQACDTPVPLPLSLILYMCGQFCIENGLDVMEPGAGGGDFKFLRGFDPAIVNSCHYCTHPGLRGAVSGGYLLTLVHATERSHTCLSVWIHAGCQEYI